MKKDKIKDLNKQELVELIQSSIKGNSIELGGIAVSSTNESLKVVEKTINKLVKKHENFLLMRKELKLKTGASYVD